MRWWQPRRACIDLGTAEPPDIFQLSTYFDDCMRRAACLKTNHKGCGEWPGLGGVILNVVHGDASLFGDLAYHRILQTLTRLDKPRNRRVAAGRPSCLATQERTLAVAHQDYDRRINPRKLFLGAGRIRAAQHVAGTLRHEMSAAVAAEAVP